MVAVIIDKIEIKTLLVNLANSLNIKYGKVEGSVTISPNGEIKGEVQCTSIGTTQTDCTQINININVQGNLRIEIRPIHSINLGSGRERLGYSTNDTISFQVGSVDEFYEILKTIGN